MAESGIVRRYVRALFDIAHQREIVQQVGGDLDALAAVLKSTPQLGRVLRAPTIAPARKRQLLRTVFGGRMHELTQRFLDMIVEKRREAILADVPGEFRRLSYEVLNIQPAEVTSAAPLADDEREALRAALGRRTGKRIELQEAVDPALIGGAIVRIGDTILDGSVRGSLRRLRERLLSPSANGSVMRDA
jgi:F-type H+-transporting ATPase subunit delta